MHFREIKLHTHLLARQKAFYTETLQIPLIEDTANAFALQAGRTVLRFLQASKGSKPFYHFAFNIPQNQLSEAKTWLQKRLHLIRDGAGQEIIDFSDWNAHALYFFDPAGNVVELIARHHLPNRATRPFNGASLCEVSEIGLVTPQAAKTQKQLMQALQIEVYRDTVSTHFAALGDAYGLFIVVSQRRSWFPAGPDADIFPISVKLQGASAPKVELENLPYDINATGE